MAINTPELAQYGPEQQTKPQDGWFPMHRNIVMKLLSATHTETFAQRLTAYRAISQLARKRPDRLDKTETALKIQRLRRDLVSFRSVRNDIVSFCRITPVVAIPLTFKYGPDHPIIDIPQYQKFMQERQSQSCLII